MATGYAEGLFNALKGELNGYEREQTAGYRFYAEASTTTCDFSELFGIHGKFYLIYLNSRYTVCPRIA